MAGEKNLPNQEAEDTVFSNLGLTREDLGMDIEGSGNEDLEGSGNEDLGSEGSGQEDEGDEGRMTQTTFPSSAEVRPDGKGNLVGKDGKIVARSGKEARLYQDLHRTRGQAQTLQGQLNDVTGRLRKAVEIGRGLHQELETMRAQAGAIKQFGLDANEHLTALRLYKELNENPREAIKKILTRATTNGINMADLGLQGGVDPKSLVDVIKQEIGNAVNPLKERTEAEKRQAEQTRQDNERLASVKSNVDSFFNQNPDAKPYVQVFTQTLQRFPDMTLGEIWARIQLHFERNPQSRRQNSQTRSLPAGRGSAPNGGGDDFAPVTTTYDSIVQDALTKAGFVR